MFMDRKTRQHVSAFQFGLKIQWNFNKDSTRLFCGFCQTDSKVFFFFFANWFYFFIFSGPRSKPFLQELPNCTSPWLCSLFSSITDFFTWLLVKAFGIFASRRHCKWQSPLLSPTGAEEAEITQRSSEASESSKPSRLFPSHPLLPGHPPAPNQLGPGRTRLAPCPASDD